MIFNLMISKTYTPLRDLRHDIPDDVAEVIDKMLELSDIVRCEVHGPAEELEKVKEPLSGLNPTYFTFLSGVGKPS